MGQKLTREQKVWAYAARLDGVSCSDIASKLGVTRERVRKITGMVPRSIDVNLDGKCVYPNISEYMIANRYSICSLASELHMVPQTLRLCLYGEQYFRQNHIDMLLERTGLTYEKAFQRKHHEDP